MRTDNLYTLPDDLPVPVDDGATDHLPGAAVPRIALPSTTGRRVDLGDPDRPLTVLYIYPHTGRPDRDPAGGLADWNAIPGARGCTPQTCSYRDHHREIRGLGAEVFGLSTQPTDYQQEMVERLHVPFEVLSDADFSFASALRLPTFEHAATTFLKRLTLFMEQGRIVDRFYPVFPPDQDAERVLAWLRRRMLTIRRATESDWDAIWRIFHAVVRQGDTYSYDPRTTEEEGRALWTTPQGTAYVACQGEQVVGIYFLKPSQPGLGSHVANAGYMVAPGEAGRGVGRAMCQHSLDEARRAGFLAMQFNFVVSTNTRAVALWQNMGFRIVGTLPKAFRHQQLGLVDVYVMYRLLGEEVGSGSMKVVVDVRPPE